MISREIAIRLRFCSNLEESSLYEEIPHSTSLININLDKIPRFSTSKFTSPPRVLAHERFFDDKIRFR